MLDARIKDVLVKTMAIGQPYLAHLYRSCQPEDLENSMCFQILGFDIILDRHLNPTLLEVNASPSFSTDSPLDYKVKKDVIGDAMQMLNVSKDRRARYEEEMLKERERRILTGKVS